MQTKVLRIISVMFVLLALIALCTPVMAQDRGQGGGAGQGRGGGGGRGPQAPPLLMTTTAFEDGGVIPDKYTQKAGPNAVSPELKWSQVPMGTQSFVLILHDPEPVLQRSSKTDVLHWLVWNIPATSTGLPEGVMQGELADGTRQLSLRGQGYMGPGAPAGPYHHYTFELYALDTKVDVPQPPAQGANANEVRTKVFDAMDGHVLGKAVLVGRFHQ
jgi:Raf kinase inhibitor-like YbhB/YbcL family protein